jgi:hypothetical protein
MSRLRKIYKGEENWDVLYNEQDQILTNPHLVKGGVNSNENNNQSTSPTSSKIFREDNKQSLLATPTSLPPNVNFNFNFNLNKTNLNNQLNKISNKMTTVGISNNSSIGNQNISRKDNLNNNNDDDLDVQDLFFENDINQSQNNNQEIHPEINEKDFDNFDHFYETNSLVSGASSVYKREKRLYSEAFGKEEDAKSMGGESVYSHVSKRTKKD